MIKEIKHPYEDEFESELTSQEFFEWLFSNLKGFVLNVMKNKQSPMKLRDWIEWFLDWSEYSDYMNWIHRNDNK